ncbi:hypothetical protein SAMN05421823_11919 [Catalinimonas alkaloidigena]|uniref:Uncharacterized protein n=1 Tax=Catalinimonas alkaloidigena TaxID=1075417 RepID=A0A1G9V5F1_9BACT|nr:hypothetical protein SAMN05421823_11919 [Catalinimonas alkaloidigena]
MLRGKAVFVPIGGHDFLRETKSTQSMQEGNSL